MRNYTKNKIKNEILKYDQKWWVQNDDRSFKMQIDFNTKYEEKIFKLTLKNDS